MKTEELELFLIWINDNFIQVGGTTVRYLSVDSNKEYSTKEISQLYLNGN